MNAPVDQSIRYTCIYLSTHTCIRLLLIYLALVSNVCLSVVCLLAG